jgi:hypothetical protein
MISLHFGNSQLMHYNYASITKSVTNEIIIKLLVNTTDVNVEPSMLFGQWISLLHFPPQIQGLEWYL